jgi:hypothetical protein
MDGAAKETIAIYQFNICFSLKHTYAPQYAKATRKISIGREMY